MTSRDFLAGLFEQLRGAEDEDRKLALVFRWLDKQFARDGGDTGELLQALNNERQLWPQTVGSNYHAVAAFIARIAAGYGGESVLDPVCGFGYLLFA